MTGNSKSWIYTLNNYTDEDIEQIKAWDNVTMHRCCKEIGSEGTKHLQGAITFIRTYTIKALKKLNPKIHWEKAKTKDADIYCTKGEIIININNRRQGQKKTIKLLTNDEIIQKYEELKLLKKEALKKEMHTQINETKLSWYIRHREVMDNPNNSVEKIKEILLIKEKEAIKLKLYWGDMLDLSELMTCSWEDEYDGRCMGAETQREFKLWRHELAYKTMDEINRTEQKRTEDL